jgi:NAD(P)-dependent dehydrogenase (short-subunit alcohol dehydrogenase family)
MELLKDKIALVTGAAQGIGREIALVFAEQGANVMMADIAGEKVALTAQEIAGCTGRRVLGMTLDVMERWKRSWSDC